MEFKDYFSNAQWNEIEKGINRGFTKEQLFLYVNPAFTPTHMEEIRTGLDQGLSVDEVSLYANPSLTLEQAHEIKKSFLDGFSYHAVSMFAKPEFDYRQMLEIKTGIANGLSQNDIKIFAKPEFTAEQMFQIKQLIKHHEKYGIPKDEILNAVSSGFNEKKVAHLLNFISSGRTFSYSNQHSERFSGIDNLIAAAESRKNDFVSTKSPNKVQGLDRD